MSSFVDDIKVLSEVHLECSSGVEFSFSAFRILGIGSGVDFSSNQDETSNQSSVLVDNDGDLVLSRRKRHESVPIVKIGHSMKTLIPDVGLQVWRGALFLSSYIIQHSDVFSGKTIVELGSGTGFVSIIAAKFAAMTFATDVGTEVLNNCKNNVDLNLHGFLTATEFDSIKVRQIDWNHGWPQFQQSKAASKPENPFQWSESDIDLAEDADIVLAADVIYSKELTSSLFEFLVRFFMSGNSGKVMFLALEKRYNFSVEDLEVVANGYSHFKGMFEEVEEFSLCGEGTSSHLHFQGKQLDTGSLRCAIPEYELGQDMEIWEFWYS